MSIVFDSGHRTFKLDTPSSSYIIGIYSESYILNLYYGPSVPDSFVPNVDKRPPSASFSLANPVITENGFTPDTAPMEYGCNGAADFRISALAIRNANGDSVTDMRYAGHKIYPGKPSIPSQPSSLGSEEDCETLELYAADPATGLRVTLFYTVFADSDVVARRVRVENPTDRPCEVERVFSLCADLSSMDYDMISLYGRHCRERQLERRPLAHGVQGVESKRGVSGHSQNPFVALAEHSATEDHGEVYAFSLVYSGNFSALAECDHNATTRFIMGINPTDFSWHLDPGESFDSPEALELFTDGGLGEMSRKFHRFMNTRIIRGRWANEKRPLLINSWEAAYFDFDTEKLVAFAKSARELGIEMLVMDDGWFGKRNNDTNSLGDWTVNTDKLPGGLAPLIERVNAEGLKFGIWYEPEMISPDSELFRAHPDWHVHVDGREPMIGRHQYVLDVSREDVRENIWNQLYSVLSQNKIDYVKWDFNRNISDAGSALLPPERKKEFFHRFILGTYDLMNRLVTTFPDILFENCSGGGGRFDPAMLCYSPQIWTSDNTDPIDRLCIQFGTSMCYPASAMSAHVSACSRTGYQTKGNVALWGTFGYELDPRKLTPAEADEVRRQVGLYHDSYDLVRKGDLYRLVSPFEDRNRAAWMLVAPDKSRAMFTMVTVLPQVGGYVRIRLKGLDPAKYYKNEQTGEVCSGALLMGAGIILTHTAYGQGESVTILFSEV